MPETRKTSAASIGAFVCAYGLEIGGVAMLATILAQQTHVVPWRLFLPVLLGISALMLWQNRTVIGGPRRFATILLLFVVSLALVVNPFSIDAGADWPFVAAKRGAGVIAAWTFILPALAIAKSRLSGSAINHEATRHRPWLSILLFSAVAVLGLALVHKLVQADFVSYYDEPVYVLQSRLMTEPGFARELDESLTPFFALRQTVFDGGQFHTQYPPGQPAVLAAFDMIGLRWWTGIIMSTIGIAFTYLLGREVLSEYAGRAAAGLLLTNYYFVTYGPTYMPHATGIAAVTCAAWLVVSSRKRSGWGWHASWLAVGALLGFIVAIRPVTGVALGISLALWHLLRAGWKWQSLRGWTVAGVGAVLPIVATLSYNSITNGSPWVFGYTAAHGSLHDLGFGTRGFVEVDAFGEWTLDQHEFTIDVAGRNLLDVTTKLAGTMLPAGLLVPLVMLGYRHGYAPRLAAIAAFLVLPAIHFFYFYDHARFYLELFPFVLVGIACLLARVREINPRLASRVVVGAIAAQLLTTGLDVRRRAIERPLTTRHSAVNVALAAHKAGDKVLLFADRYLVHWASWLNIDEFPGDIIVARNLGPVRNVDLMARFPNHRPMLLTMDGGTVRMMPPVAP